MLNNVHWHLIDYEIFYSNDVCTNGFVNYLVIRIGSINQNIIAREEFMSKEKIMHCIDPNCNGDVRVIDVRYSGSQNATRRRKVCNKCGKRFTTWESTVAPKITKGIKEYESFQLLQIKEILKGNLVKQFRRTPRGANITEG